MKEETGCVLLGCGCLICGTVIALTAMALIYVLVSGVCP